MLMNWCFSASSQVTWGSTVMCPTGGFPVGFGGGGVFHAAVAKTVLAITAASVAMQIVMVAMMLVTCVFLVVQDVAVGYTALLSTVSGAGCEGRRR